MAAMQPFMKERKFPVNAAEKFKNHLDPDQFAFYRKAYPSHTSVAPLDVSLQLTALRAKLSVVQISEDNRKTISKAAVTATNAQSFVISAGSSPGGAVNASQAEKTIATYKKTELICFGCGGNHA